MNDYIPDYEIFPSEFKGEIEYDKIFAKNGLNIGRMICGSKSMYCTKYPKHLIIFNANIVTKLHGKCWFGDVDINLDFDNLKNVADELKEDLYILREHDARFETENDPTEKLISKAVTTIKCKE